MSDSLLSTADRNKKAAINGLVLGIIYIIFATLTNMIMGKGLFMYYILKLVCYIIYFVAVGIMAKNLRNANGGYMEFREVFGAVFVMLAVGWAIGYLYSFLYMYVIDPGYMDTIKNATMQFMEKSGAPDESIDEAMKNFEDSKKFSLGKSIMGYFGWLILDCLFGLIVCAIVKKKRPMFEPQ